MSKLLCATLFFIFEIIKGTNEANIEAQKNESLQRMINEAINDIQDFSDNIETTAIRGVENFEMIDSEETSFVSALNEENFVNVPNNIASTQALNGKNKCGGFFIPGLGFKFIDANSPLFPIHQRISRIRIEIDLFNKIVRDISKRIQQKKLKFAFSDFIINSLKVVGSFSESNIHSFHIFIVKTENILKACGASRIIFSLVLKFAENLCQDFESTIGMLNDNLKMILDKF
ncbi:hypothetical protein CWI38_0518p0010 [Hamiltosporidium tvaerminnensis]|uniref:Uncharacterized protein n=1 Tax=Hamiltosporidium tvaerminnensis TaxID=1176355 RepID=A0A4Q9LZA1_9MICR|nr:hypothetical protein CWI38_0518p0010 [Hamiltosporidium tvaerminnensis]